MSLGRKTTIARSADTPVIDSSPVEGNLVQVKKPKFITLVGHPANQTGFKVIRGEEAPEEEDPTPAKPTHPVIRRTRRGDTSPVLRLTFPEGNDEATVAEALKTYGLSSYKIKVENRVYTATRADLKSITRDDPKVMDIMLEPGLIATVARQVPTPGTGAVSDKAGLTLAELEFDASKFTLEEVQRWTSENCVDGTLQEQQNAGACYVVRRSDIPENEETRRMVLEDGITAVIVRSDCCDIPAGYVSVVSEAAYGNWGWGQLDFAAKMADRVFSEQMDDASSSLRSVLNEILLYSCLPLDVRKELANRALAQYGEYIGTVMDSLPRQLLVAVVRASKVQAVPQANTSATQDTPTTPLENSMTTEAQTGTTAAVTEAVLTRAEVQTMISEAVQALAVTATPTAAVATAAATEATATPATDTLSRADLTAALTAATAPLLEEIKALKGVTVVRSAPEAVVAAVEDDKKKSTDVFRGAFGNLRAAK